MPIEESTPVVEPNAPLVQLGQEVIDKDGKKLGKVRARFPAYFLVERGAIFVKAYYVPHSAIRSIEKNIIHISLSEGNLQEMGLNSMPDDLYVETPEPGVPHYSGVALFARGPLSPAETGHYNYGRRWPGINTDASGSYYPEEVLPKPEKFVSDRVYTTDLPIEPRDTNPDR
jgi:hypothetical protein